MIFQVFNVLLITSCTLKVFKKNDDFYFNDKKHQLQKLIVPKGIKIPIQNKNYNIPYTKNDLEQNNFSISPPV